MAYFLFIDESGQDRTDSPYEVLAGIAVEDRNLWNFIQAVQQAEIRQFGTRYSHGHRELKAKKILNRKTFRKAHQLSPFPPKKDNCLLAVAWKRGTRQVFARSLLWHRQSWLIFRSYWKFVPVFVVKHLPVSLMRMGRKRMLVIC